MSVLHSVHAKLVAAITELEDEIEADEIRNVALDGIVEDLRDSLGRVANLQAEWSDRSDRTKGDR